MVNLNEQISIPVSFEKLCAWADNFEKENAVLKISIRSLFKT
jgi:hypothetical protein